MIIFVTPDELPHLSHLPNVKPCDGLESLTGADFCLSQAPISPIANISFHLARGSTFVNLKRGYDLVVNHDSPKNFAARGQALGIQPGRMILLGVGQYRDSGGKLTIAGYNEPPSAVTYSTYLQCQVNALSRGLVWMTIPTNEHLLDWIKSWGKRPTEPLKVLSKPSYNWHEDDFWQTVEEPPDNSVEKVLSCGFPGFGPKTVLSITQYLKDNQLPVTLFNALMILSTCDTKGKRVFKIPGVGDKTFKQVREILYGDKPFSTLNVSAFDGHGNFAQGAQTALDQFHAFFQEKLNKGVKPNQAYNEAMAIVRSGISELIPF